MANAYVRSDGLLLFRFYDHSVHVRKTRAMTAAGEYVVNLKGVFHGRQGFKSLELAKPFKTA